MTALNRVLSGLGSRRIVVVTDRYPPDGRGGAEVSLHIALSSMDAGDEVLVVTFGDRTVLPSRYRIDGIEVLLLPRQGAWPLHRLPLVASSSLETWVGTAGTKTLRTLAQSVAGSRMSREDAALGVEISTRIRPRGGPVLDFLEYPNGLAPDMLRRVLKRCTPRILHADNYRAILISSVASSNLSLARVAVVRDNRFHCVRYDQSATLRGHTCQACSFDCSEEDAPNHPELQRRALRKTSDIRVGALRRMDRVIVTSRYLEEAISPLVGDNSIVRIANAPDDLEDVDDFTLGVAELPGTNLLVVGMLNENKGQLDLVRELDQLSTRVPDVRIHFAGRGRRIEKALRETARRTGHEDRLVFHGFVDRRRLYELYAECQIAVLPTKWPEPFGRVPIEAGVARRPVVAFGVGGLRETIVHGETGSLVPPGDFDGLIDEIGTLADDPALRWKMGRAARAHVTRHFGIRQLREKLAATWSELSERNAG